MKSDFFKKIKFYEVENKKNGWGMSFGALKIDDDDLESMLKNSNTIETKLNDDQNADISIEKDSIRKSQHNLCAKVNFKRKGWLITDLVTVGSPLSHGNILLADDEDDFALRIEEREYPICPTIKDGKKYSYRNAEGEDNIHHAMPIGFTRWTNNYYT